MRVRDSDAHLHIAGDAPTSALSLPARTSASNTHSLSGSSRATNTCSINDWHIFRTRRNDQTRRGLATGRVDLADSKCSLSFFLTLSLARSAAAACLLTVVVRLQRQRRQPFLSRRRGRRPKKNDCVTRSATEEILRDVT